MSAASAHLPRWLMAVLALAFLALLAGGAWFYDLQQQAMVDEVEKELTTIARLKADQIIAWRSDQIADAAIHAHPFLLPSVARFMAAPTEAHRHDLHTRFRTIAAQHDYTDILLVDPGGAWRLGLSEHRFHHQGYASALGAAFRQASPVFVDLHREAPGRPPHISVVAPLFEETGQGRTPLGAMILITDASRFLYPLIASWPTPSRSAETFLVRRDGDHALFLNDLRHHPDAALNLRIPLGRNDAPSVMAVLGGSGFARGKDYRGEAVAAVSLPIPGAPWCMVAKIDDAEAFGDWRFRSGLLVALIAGALSLVAAFGLVLWQRAKKVHFRSLYRSEAALRAGMERHSITLKAIGDAVIATDAAGRVELLNPVAEALTGWSQDAAAGKALAEIFRIIDARTRQPVSDPVATVLREGVVVGLANHTVLIARDGAERQIADSAAPIRDVDGAVTGVVLVFRDVSEEYRMRETMKASQARYRDLLESTASITWEYDIAADRWTYVAPQVKTILGWAPGDWADMAFWTDNLHPDDRDTAFNHCMACTEKGENHLLEYRFRSTSGDYLWLRDVVTVEMENHRPARLRGVMIDITDRKRGEAHMQRLTSAIEHTSDGIVITDEKGAIAHVNPAFTRMTGYASSEALGRNPRFLKSGEQDAAFYRHLWRTILSGDTWQGRMTNRRKDGTRYIEESTISPVRDATGRIVNFVAVNRDITAEIRMEEKLLQAQKIEAIGTLAGGIAHDFNNILFPIVGISELLLEDLPRQSQEREFVREILTAGRRGSDLVKQILAFSRQSDGKRTPVRMQQVLKEVIKLARATIPANITISHQIQPDCALVMADPTQVHQIAMNLVTNAYHAVESTGGRIAIELDEITVGGSDEPPRPIAPGRYARLTVSDTGGGIDPAVVDKIFEPYFTTKAQGKGTGLGLSIVYGIVRQLGGEITVSSAAGTGTTFTVCLPLMTPSADTEADAAVPATGLEIGSERILLVDDEAVIVDLERQMLERLGYRVSSRLSSIEALEAFKARPGDYDLVISDMSMPILTGDRLARALLDIRADIPVIICTGFSERLDPERAAAMGIKGFLMKPVIRADMARMVRAVLDEARAPGQGAGNRPPETANAHMERSAHDT